MIVEEEYLEASGYTSRKDVTPASHPDHHTVGKEFMGSWPAKRWFCESHDQAGYWMYATDGSGQWTNVSERAIGRSFHEIYRDGGRLFCPGWTVQPYVKEEA
jgi:hypothetical protein